MLRAGLLAIAAAVALARPSETQDQVAGVIVLESGEHVPFYDLLGFNYGTGSSRPTVDVFFQGAARPVPREALLSVCVTTFSTATGELSPATGATLLLVTSETTTEAPPVYLYSVSVKERDPFSGALTQQAYLFMKYDMGAKHYVLNIRRIDFAPIPAASSDDDVTRVLAEAHRRLLAMPNHPPACG